MSAPQPTGPQDAAPISIAEAVRKALAAGFEGPQDGPAYILKTFGIEITPSRFLAAKATERKKSWAKNGKPGRKPKQSAESREQEDGGEVNLIE